MNFILKSYALQDIGKRTAQQDCFFPPFIDPCHFDETDREWAFYDRTAHLDDRLFILCDGMGGHDRGEVASQIVVETMSKSLLKSAPVEGPFSDDILKQSVTDAIEALWAEEDPNEEKKMGTTMTVLKFHSDGATIGHIGDSRVYHFRPAKGKEPARILFRTEDHTVVNYLVHNGTMTVLEAAKSPRRHVLSRSMSSMKGYVPELDIHHIADIQPGDIFMLCSDGIYENLDDDKLLKLICDPNYNGEELMQQLMHLTKDNRDNHTAFLVQVEDVFNSNDKKHSSEVLMPGAVIKSDNYTYHVEKVLGQGTFGITYLVNTSVAMQGPLGTIHTDVKLALKEFFMHNEMKREGTELFSTSQDSRVSTYAEKFRNEAKKLAMLSHPNIVKVLEVFDANNTIYYTMEYLPGGSLNDYVNKTGGLPEQKALLLIRQISYALDYLHMNKMLHLDVKPANIMLDPTSDTIKLIDFGLSKQYEENGEAISSDKFAAGTSGYAPLDQTADFGVRDFSPQLDVYALGATYYKMLTAIVPNSAIDVLNNGLRTMPLVKKHISQQSIDAIKAAMQPMVANRLKNVKAFMAMLPRVEDTAAFHQQKDTSHWKWIFAITIVIALAAIIIAIILKA